jgi:biopolymer transport protein ExbD
MASVSASAGRGRATITGINVTPMVDVVLVLLVIMMVSATYIVSQSLHVELPKTATSDDSVSSPATVTLTKERATYFNGERVSEAQLQQKLSAAYAKNGDVDLIVSADADASHGAVVHVIDLAKTVGISKFAINVERKK